jgi:hypothetical protein
MTRYELREYERQQTEKALRAVPPKVRVQPEYTLRDLIVSAERERSLIDSAERIARRRENERIAGTDSRESPDSTQEPKRAK